MFFVVDVSDEHITVIDELDAEREDVSLRLGLKLKKTIMGYQKSDSFTALTAGDIVKYVLSRNKLTGQVKDSDYVLDIRGASVILLSAAKTVKHAIIPFGVTRIGSYAFKYSEVESVVIPPTVSVIGEQAFCKCEKLKKIVMPDSVALIESHAFAEASVLEEVVLSKYLCAIWDNAFLKCGQLKKIELPETLTELNDGCFAFCLSLKEIKIPKRVEKLPAECFFDCIDLETVDISEGVRSIDDKCFTGCRSLKSITIPNSIYNIHYRAFRDTGKFVVKCKKDCTAVKELAEEIDIQVEYM